MTAINEKVYIGSVDAPTITFNQRNIENIVCNNSVDLIGDELSSDTLEVGVFFDDADEVLRSVAYGTPVFYYSNDYLVGKYYVSEIQRKGLERYLIRATSLIGLIAKEDFYGGFYSGDTFQKVLEDILFTNGVSLTKYKLYTPIGKTTGNYYTSTKVWFGESSSAGFKYRAHLEFIYRGDFRTLSAGGTNTTILGRSNYYAQVTSSLSDGGNPVCAVSVYYGSSGHSLGYWSGSPGYKIIGVGSKFVIDVDPIAGTGYIGCDYINPDTLEAGHLETTWTFTASTSTNTVYMTCAFGGTGTSGAASTYQSAKLQWEVYRVWDETGTLIIDAMFGTNEDGSICYVANAATGYVVSTSYYEPYGSLIGTVSDFTRVQRDLELADSIVYSDGVAALQIRGWLNIGTRREAMHHLLFANNVCLLKTGNGKFLFTKLTTAQVGTVSEECMFDDSEEELIDAAKKISVTEHSYETSGATSEVIFDNSSCPLVDGQYIAVFEKAPVFGALTASGLTIINSNCNAAVVTGRGTITGAPYLHSKTVIQQAGSASDGSDVSVSNVGLITSANSDSIMSKLKAYYSGKLSRIKNSIKYSGERCGLVYGFKTLYSDDNSAYLVKIVAKSSSFVKAACEFISGFSPVSSSGYTDYAIVTYSSDWTVPAELRSSDSPTIRLNIIGKGHDGTAGANGEAGSRGSYGDGALQGGAGGAGGEAGSGGAGGNVYAITLDVTNINKISVSNSGYNTIVRTYNDSGTLVNTYSSASGVASDSGFMNIFTGVYYARKGSDGINGGAGGKGGYITLSSGVTTKKGESGGDAGDYTGGVSYDCIVRSVSYTTGTGYEYNSYGGGGGAAYGNNGGNAYRGNEPLPGIVETHAGDGANAIVPDNVYTEYGSGGFGGNGGGGGGGAGTRTAAAPDEYGNYSYSTYYYWSGAYGTGSSGTPGIDGCVIIYY